MNEIKFIHLAQNAIVDKLTNNLSIINLLDGFQGVAFPLVVPPFVVVLKAKRNVATDPDTAEYELIISQKGNELHRGKFKVEYQGKPLSNIIITVMGLVVQEPSPIEVTCMFEGKVIASIEMQIKNITPQVEKKE